MTNFNKKLSLEAASFEKWARVRGHEVKRRDGSEYFCVSELNELWACWLAAKSSSLISSHEVAPAINSFHCASLKEREQFEAWANVNGYLVNHERYRYCQSIVNSLFECWKAAKFELQNQYKRQEAFYG